MNVMFTKIYDSIKNFIKDNYKELIFFIVLLFIFGTIARLKPNLKVMKKVVIILLMLNK